MLSRTINIKLETRNNKQETLRLNSGQALRLRSGQALRLRSGQALRLRSGQALRLRSGQARNKSFRLQVSGYRLQVKSGFALVEILLSVIFILALITIFLSSATTYIHTRKSNLQTIAAKIASREIENLRKIDTAGFDTLTDGSISDPELTKLPQGTGYRTAAIYSPSPDTSIKQITIEVTWTEKGNQQKIITDTLLYRNGL